MNCTCPGCKNPEICNICNDWELKECSNCEMSHDINGNNEEVKQDEL